MNFDVGEVLSREIAYLFIYAFSIPLLPVMALGLWDYNYPYEGGLCAQLWAPDSWSDATTSLANGTNLEE
jgi:hypothetical protein